jgi:iron complex outermembrane receptor protein/outer membrane receptor for ferrienterochelin and colicins
MRISVVDSVTTEPVFGAIVNLKNTSFGSATDSLGRVVFFHIPNGEQVVVVNSVGFLSKEVIVDFPRQDTAVLTILLVSSSNEMEEVMVSSTRTNSRIEDLPVKVEVLGQEDMDEESTIVPGGVGSILGDLSIITIQRTNPVNGNDAVRMQGLDSKYTQMLRDGLPLYDGFSGSIGVLSIPPLDLKQVEIIKGSASTLYGGGAIGGLINFISKEPTDSTTATLTLNYTTLQETNFNSFLSGKKGTIGGTLFAGVNLKAAQDINNDGFTEVPEQRNIIIHPRLFFYPTKKLTGNVGFTFTQDERNGGDMQALTFGADSVHTFLFGEKVQRSTLDTRWNFTSGKNSITLKSAVSRFNRDLTYAGFLFDGRQTSSYSEVSNVFKSGKHTWVNGANLNTDAFERTSGDTVLFGNYNYSTIGLFSQDDWQIKKQLTLEGGIRLDYSSRYAWFILPQVGLFFKPSEHLSLRLHYGTGYKTPSIFALAQPQQFAQMVDITNNILPEKSVGYNLDVNYQTIVFEKILIQVNQALYYTQIANPTVLNVNASGNLFVANADFQVNSLGTDTYVRLSLDSWECYLGYNHTLATQKSNGAKFNTPFNPQDKFAVTIAYEVEGKWRMGVEAARNGNQYIYNNERVPDYWFFAGMVERKFKHGSVVLNCENIGDYRQSKKERIVFGSVQNPQFAEFWGPVEGRVLNLSLKLML